MSGTINLCELVLVENVFPECSIKMLDSLFHSDEFPWYYCKSIGLNEYSIIRSPKHENSVSSSGFSHLFCYPDADNKLKINSNYWDLIYEMIRVASDKLGVDPKKLVRCKANLSTPQPSYPEGSFSSPHIDSQREHTVALIYLNNSDGDTVIFEEQHKFPDGKEPETVTIREAIPHKENTALVFDGSIYHSAGLPINSTKRINLNLDFEV